LVAIEFGILGPLEASIEGEPVRLGAGKQSALLAILLLSANEVVSSDRLIDELWGESAPDTAAKALQVHISQLRKALEPERGAGGPGRLLITRSPGYMLALEPEQLDLTRFDRLVREGREALASDDPVRAAERLRDALALWRGPALADLAYEEFAQREIARLGELRIAALEDRLEADLACGHHAEVVAELEALVADEPLRERARGQLMVALYRSGRQADALDAYRSARDALVRELGIEPGKELQRLHRAILDQDPELDLALGPSVEHGPPRARAAGGEVEATGRAGGASDLVGRERELAELETALERAIEGHGSICMLGGEPGIGKTRLADELAGVASARNARVLWGRCWEAGGAPAYWPWVQALRSYIADAETESLRSRLGPRGSEVAQLLPELRERLPDLSVPASADQEGARFRLFDATADFIKRAAADTPCVLVLDDLHAADTPSLLLLRFMVGEIADAPVLVLGTYRDVEVGPDHPLDAALNDLARHQASRLIPLGGLEESQVSRLIAASAQATVSRRSVSAIHRGTGGNPLFVEELVQLLVSENRLEDAADDAGVRVAIPRGVHEVIGRRLEKVSEECRRALGVAAVIGREFDLEALAEVTGRPARELLDVLDEAISERIVTEVSGTPDRLRFSHVLIRDVLYEELGASRRRHLHDRAGEALEALFAADPDPHLAELAYHFFEAGPTGDPAKALESARRAGDHAARQLAYEEAARLYELGIRVLRTAGRTDEPARCDLMLALAEARLRAGEEEDAKATFLGAAEIARRLDDAEALGRAALGYGGLVVWPAARGDPHLVPLLEEALAALPDLDSSLRARLIARLSCAVRDQPDRDRGLPLSEEAVEMARRLDDPRTLAYALGAQCVLVTDPGSMERLAGTALEVVAVAERIGELERAFTGHLYHLCSLFSAGDVEGTKRTLKALTRHGENLRAATYLWGSAEVEAALALFEGRFDAAEELTERAHETGRHAQQFNAATAYQLQRFLLRRERGGLEGCEEDLREVATKWPTYRILSCALASLYAELGRTDKARATFEELARNDFEQVYFDEEFLASMTLLADVCASLGDVERAAMLYERLLPHGEWNAFGMIEIALGSVARPLGLLARTLGHGDQAMAHFESAIAMNERMGARPWVAHAKLDLGRTLTQAGDRPRIERAKDPLTDALGVYRTLGMAPWERKAERALDDLGVQTG
jgi:DNA-binding SARP family transcriptional activator